MKADITIPNPLYETSEKLAQQLGMSLSDFFLAALTTYIETYQSDGITEQLNQVYQTEPSTLEPDIMTFQLASLDRDTW
jgi:hypothetical protein